MSSDEIPLVLNDVLEVPLYELAKQYRLYQKTSEQGANTVLRAVKDLHQRVATKEGSGEKVESEKVIAALDKISTKLMEMKSQAMKASNHMQESLETLTFRLAMRNTDASGAALISSEAHDSKRARSSHDVTSTDRMLELAVISNHLLRTGRFDTFKELCKEGNCGFLLPDVNSFQAHADIVTALLDHRNAEPALEWCNENKTALKRKNSSLPLNLRLRQFFQIVEKGDAKEAVLFARKHMVQFAQDEKMRKAMATLAFIQSGIYKSPYKSFFDDERWSEIAKEFLTDRNSVLNLSPVSPLEIVIRVGLSVIKTASCRPDGPGRASGCPACQPSLGKLAITVPRTLRERSALVCRITGQPMEEPLVMPNGQAYSKIALEHMALTRGDGKVLCPTTHQEFNLKDCRRAYVL